MRKALGLALCVSLLTLVTGCGLDTLVSLAGVDISGLDIDGLMGDLQTLAEKYSSGSGSSWDEATKTSCTDTEVPWFNPWR
jgi:hypothetical protein